MIKNIHIKRVISFSIAAVILIALIVSETVREHVLNAVKISLDYDELYWIIICLSLLIGLYYTFYYAKNSQPKDLKLLFKVFGPLFDPPANTLTYGIVLSSVLRLIKGLFNQYFFDIEYFKDFSFINVSAIALACIPLLIWSVNGLSKYVFAIFIRGNEEIGQVSPIVKEEEEGNKA